MRSGGGRATPGGRRTPPAARSRRSSVEGPARGLPTRARASATASPAGGAPLPGRAARRAASYGAPSSAPRGRRRAGRYVRLPDASSESSAARARASCAPRPAAQPREASTRSRPVESAPRRSARSVRPAAAAISTWAASSGASRRSPNGGLFLGRGCRRDARPTAVIRSRATCVVALRQSRSRARPGCGDQTCRWAARGRPPRRPARSPRCSRMVPSSTSGQPYSRRSHGRSSAHASRASCSAASAGPLSRSSSARCTRHRPWRRAERGVRGSSAPSRRSTRGPARACRGPGRRRRARSSIIPVVSGSTSPDISRAATSSSSGKPVRRPRRRGSAAAERGAADDHGRQRRRSRSPRATARSAWAADASGIAGHEPLVRADHGHHGLGGCCVAGTACSNRSARRDPAAHGGHQAGVDQEVQRDHAGRQRSAGGVPVVRAQRCAACSQAGDRAVEVAGRA